MSSHFPRRNFVCANMASNFLVEVKSNLTRISLRTWLLSNDSTISSVIGDEDARKLYGEHVAPFELNSDLNESRDFKKNHWVPLESLGGNFFDGRRNKNLFLKPISQVGFSVDKSIIGSSAWSDYAVWVFNARRDGSLSMPFNRYMSTYSSKQHRNILLVSREEINILTLIVPFATDDLSECTFTLRYNREHGCIHDFNEYSEMPSENIGFDTFEIEKMYGVKALMPSLRLAGPDRIAANMTGQYSVEMYSKNTDTLVDDVTARVYLEANAGYLPQRQVEIKNGVANFPLYALGLSPGDRIKLKVGWRNYSGADEKIITIV